MVRMFSFLGCREAKPPSHFLGCPDDGFSDRVLCEGGYPPGGANLSHVLVVAAVVADVPETGVHLGGELGHVAQHTHRPGHSTPGVEDVVLRTNNNKSSSRTKDKIIKNPPHSSPPPAAPCAPPS